MLTRSWILSIFLSSGARGTRAKNLTAVQEEHAGPSTHSSRSACRHAALGASGAVLFSLLFPVVNLAICRLATAASSKRPKKSAQGRGRERVSRSLPRWWRRRPPHDTACAGPRLHLQLKATRPGRNKTRIRQVRRWTHRLEFFKRKKQRLVIKSKVFFIFLVVHKQILGRKGSCTCSNLRGAVFNLWSEWGDKWAKKIGQAKLIKNSQLLTSLTWNLLPID